MVGRSAPDSSIPQQVSLDGTQSPLAFAKIGLISDTHGLLRSEALSELQGCDAILHAGDIGNIEVLNALGTLAPVTAIRGNNDLAWAVDLPDTIDVSLYGLRFWLIHDINDDAFGPPPADCEVIVCGHSHRPNIQTADGRLVVNPGSAGPRRFNLPITVAIMHVMATGPHTEIRVLSVTSASARKR
ncbi:metallophosphoesterase family protein [Chitinasiproducens palmae]|uniref:Phosphoesterase n=1 Tax=Chitinasiproducens palmae TaxID=1770053 RepID=A0A1H2PKJ2_9BURK|nr:metallophosphoesterase family protein [Chitinasiproducens palmae]SDV46084.1 hypothetical protein SAMN05216551_10161 [Chitinasiproducens palmae]